MGKNSLLIHREWLRTFTLLLLLLSGGSMNGYAQPLANLVQKQVEPLDSQIFVCDHDVLVFPSNHARFDALYQRLQRGQEEGVDGLSILHIGGSHVQAGVFSGRMRQNLCALSPQQPVGRGMMFPFSVMGTNGPRDYSFSSTGRWSKYKNVDKSPEQTLGLAGACIVADDLSSTLSLHYSQPFESVLLFGENLVDTAFVLPLIIADGDTIYAPRTSGESGYEFMLSHPVTECTVALSGDSCGSFAFRGMIVDPYSGGISYSESGINGAAVPSWLKCAAFQKELETVAPDLVIFGIGINDANVQNFSPEQFKQNYRTLIHRIQTCNPDCAFLFITNNDCYLRAGRSKKTFNRNTEQVEQAFLELAGEYDGAVWNLYQLMGGYKSSARWVKAGLMRSDYVHFTQRGYELLGDLLYNAILQDYLGWTKVQQEQETDVAENIQES